MGAGLTSTDGFFTVREEAWHRFAKPLADYPTLAEAKALAHPWEPIQEPLYRRVPIMRTREHVHGIECHSTNCPMHGVMEEYPDSEYVEAESVQLNVRSDNGYELGATSKEYGLVTNQDLYDIADALEGHEPGQVMLETGGSLQGGRKVWLLVRLREPLVLKGRDSGTGYINYFALQNAHDGTASCRGQAVNTRIVCMNTATAASYEAQTRGTEFVFNHTANVAARIEEAKQALTMWRTSLDGWKLQQEALLDLSVSLEGSTRFVEEFIPYPKAGTFSERVGENVRGAQNEFWNILRGPTCADIDTTAYGLVQAAVEYAQWSRRSRSPETLFKRAYLTDSAVVREAVKLAQSVALVG